MLAASARRKLSGSLDRPPISSAPPQRARPIQLKSSGCACGGACPSCKTNEDPFEREADAAAEQVMRKAAPPPLSKIEETPQREADPETEAQEAVPEDLGPALAGGDPLPPDMGRFFEAGFGRDFSRVRLHNDAAAGRSARALGARAYTYGRHIAFAPGEYAPQHHAGRSLIAHELAHVVQQGAAAPGVRQGAAAPGLSRGPQLSTAPKGVQRLCGPSEISDVSGCVESGGDIFGEPILFNVDCDTFRPGEQDNLRAMGRDLLGSAARVHVHGFASIDGDEGFNQDLSCLRASRAAQILIGMGISVPLLLAHGATPGPAEPRRSVVLDPRSEPEPEPEPEPTPTPTPEPTPEPSGCGTIEDFIASFLNVNPNMVADIFECICETAKLIDILESAVQFVVDVALIERIASVLNWVDCFCSFWDWMQLIYESGIGESGCWEFDAVSRSEWARIAAFFGVSLVDCFGQDIGNSIMDGLADLVFEMMIAEGAAAGSPGGPPGAAGGAALGALIGLGIRILMVRKAAEIADLLIDITTYMAQNQLTHGTPFPLDGCRSCMRLPVYFGGQDHSGTCDEWNESFVPEGIRVPEWHGTATGSREEETP